GLVFFLQRTHGRDRNNALHAQLLEAVNIGAKIQFAGKQAVPASMTREKRNLAALELAANVGISGVAEGSLLFHFLNFRQAGHVIKPAPANNADLRLRQSPSGTRCSVESELVIIQGESEWNAGGRPSCLVAS